MAALPRRRSGGRWLTGLGVIVLIAGTAPRADAQEGGSAPDPEAESARLDSPADCPEPCRAFSQEIAVVSTHPELPGSIELSGEEIRGQPEQDLVEAMRRQAGLDAVRRGPVNLDPNVRGLVETQVGTFVDGTRLFAAGPGRMDSELSHVSPQMVERMEIVKGPYALAWGAGTLGAINVETFRPSLGTSDLVSATGGVRYGENASSTDVFGGVWGSGDTWRFHLLLDSRQGDNYEDGDGNLIPGDYESTEGRLNFGFEPSDSTLVDFLIGYQEQSDIDYPGRILDATYFYTRSYGAELSWSGGAVSELFFQVYSNRKDHLMNNDEKPTAQPNPNRMPPFPIQVDLPTESNTLGGRAYAVWGGDEWRWQAGLDFYSLEQNATRFVGRRDLGVTLFSDNVWPDVDIDDLGAYFQGVLRRNDLELGATVRVDSVDASAGAASDFFLANTTGKLDQSETNVSGAISARWALAEHWSLSAGLGQAVRTANTLERYSDRFPSTKFQIAAEFMGDPDIDPETGRQLDLGVLYVRSALTFQANVFFRVIDDCITVEPDPTLPRRLPLSPMTVYRYRNGDEAEMLGGELQVDHRASDRFSWRAGLSYLDGEDTLFDEPLFGTPPPAASVGVTFGPSSRRYWIDLEARLVDSQDDVATARLEQPTPSYELVDLMAGYRFDSGLQLRLGVQNAFDERYVNHLNSLDPFTRERIAEMGRSVFAGIQYRP